MGIVGQLSENITLDGITAEPREGGKRLLSTNADATHFINCRGKIEVARCKFVQMMDDASNVHGIYNIPPCITNYSSNTILCPYLKINVFGNIEGVVILNILTESK